MARSLKKGPFADQSLLKKVDAMNAAGDKSVIKTWLSMMEENMCRYMLQKIWLDINWVSSLLQELTEDMEKTRKNQVFVNKAV